MIDRVFTEQEDNISAQIKSSFYYPQQDGWTTIKNLCASLPAESREEVLQSTLNQVAYEQKERADYIAAQMNYSNSNRLERDILARSVARKETPPKEVTASPSDSVFEQAKIYDTVATELENYYAKLSITPEINSLVGDLLKLSPETVNSFEQSIATFLSATDREKGNIVGTNPDIPAAIKKMYEKTSVGLLIDNYDTLPEKINLLATTLVILKVINRLRSDGQEIKPEVVITQVGYILGLRYTDY
jgi:hypothetical protein